MRRVEHSIVAFRVLTVAIVVLAACARTAPVPDAGDWVASDSSQYTPVARFRARSTLNASGATIVVDSGSLFIPGELRPGGPPLMTKLYLTAILAVPDSENLGTTRSGDLTLFPERRGWREVALGDSVLIADQLRYGERSGFPDLRLHVPMPATSPSGRLWIIYRISGNTVELRPPETPGGPVRRLDHVGGVRVYACGDRDARGKIDEARREGLRRAYGVLC